MHDVIEVIETSSSVVQVNTVGPQGPIGPVGPMRPTSLFNIFSDGSLTPFEEEDPFDPTRYFSQTAFIINPDGSFSPTQAASFSDLCFASSENNSIVPLTL